MIDDIEKVAYIADKVEAYLPNSKTMDKEITKDDEHLEVGITMMASKRTTSLDNSSKIRYAVYANNNIERSICSDHL